MDSEISVFNILVEHQIIKSRDAMLQLPSSTDPWASPQLKTDGQGTERSGSCRSRKREEAFGFLQLVNAASDVQPGNTMNTVECVEFFIAFIRQLYAYFGMEAIKDSHLEGQIMQLSVVLLTAHYHANQNRTRQDSTPLLMSHLGNQSHGIFPLFWIKNILSSSNVPILKIATVIIKGWCGIFCTLHQ